MDYIDKLISLALEEDIGQGDITTDNLILENIQGQGFMIAKQPFILAGLDIAERVFKTLDSKITFMNLYQDGDFIKEGEVIVKLKGDLRALLKGERTALNFLQRLSGIATNVRSYVDELKNKKVRLVDTRKTMPGWRGLEKYAVRIGGAYNHRMALYDGVLIKDNHIAVAGGIKNAVKMVRNKISHLIKIEVEVTNISQVNEALEAKVDVIMLDNMNLEQIKEAVKIINKRALVEVSGSVMKNNLNMLANTGVDIISSGALTHQAKSVDISMRINY